jgi:hypothetical protein
MAGFGDSLDAPLDPLDKIEHLFVYSSLTLPQVGTGCAGGSVFEDVRSAVDTLKTMKALLARRIDETKMWARAVIATRRTGLPRPLERRSVRPLAHWRRRVRWSSCRIQMPPSAPANSPRPGG